MKRKSSSPTKDLHRLLDAQKFESLEDLQKFMEEMMGKPIPEIAESELTPGQRAEDMVYDAYELPRDKAIKQAYEALKLDPDCIPAYELLAMTADSIPEGIVFLEKGIEIGKRVFGGEYLEQRKGMFWGFTETRPYMRCLKNYSESLFFSVKFDESIAVMEEMIALNPNDNQGVRDLLMLLLILSNDGKKFRKYDKMFKWDTLAMAEFTRALFAFQQHGPSLIANRKLQKAIKLNKHVVPVLISKKPITDVPDAFSPGSREEAELYAVFAKPIWNTIPGALNWLKEQHKS